MARFLHEFSQSPLRKWSTVFLAFFWCFGLGTGMFLSIQSGDIIASLMRAAAFGRVSIVNLLIADLLPFLLSAFAVYIHMPALLYVLAFIKAFLFAFISLGALSAFGSASWLIRLLLMFSDIGLTGLLYLYWLRHLPGRNRFSFVQSGAFGAAAVLFGSIDHAYIAPFLAQIINF